jgi:hypothetical protein
MLSEVRMCVPDMRGEAGIEDPDAYGENSEKEDDVDASLSSLSLALALFIADDPLRLVRMSSGSRSSMEGSRRAAAAALMGVRSCD